MADKNKVTMIDIPGETSEYLLTRVSPLLKEYHRQKMIFSNTMDKGSSKEFGLKELLISAYSQGLSDAVQLWESGKLEQLKK